MREMMMKLRSRRLFKRSSKGGGGSPGCGGNSGSADIEWELRPGGMLVQKREGGSCEVIMVRVSTGFHHHDISIGAISTFGDLKTVISMVTGLEPREQRLLFRGKEREDEDHLHMVGVRDKDKVLMLEDPALKEKKMLAMEGNQAVGSGCHSATVIRV